MGMGFGEKMKVPSFVKSDPKTGRMLSAGGIPMDQLDVTRDFVDIKFILRNDDIKPEDLIYNIYIKEWTADNFELKVNFSDPFQISQGEVRDVAYISIKNPALFVSESGEPFDPKSQPIIK